MQAALGKPIDIELTLGDTAHPTDRHEPAADGERVEAGCQDFGTNIIDDHVDPIGPNRPRECLAKALAAGGDTNIQPMRLEALELVRRTRGADHLGAEEFGEQQVTPTPDGAAVTSTVSPARSWPLTKRAS